MPRLRSPLRDLAFDIWRKSGGVKPLSEIANELETSEGSVRGWKAKDQWETKLNGTLQSNERNAPKKSGAPKENKNAVGNQGGAPLRNANAVTHGFFRKYFPEEVHPILEDAESISQLDMLWIAIQTQFTAIVHAQKVMFVRDQDDIVEKVKREKEGETFSEKEFEFQYPWDRQANFMAAQSRAISELRSSIKDFLALSDESDIRRMKLLQMQKEIELKNLEIERLKNPMGEEQEDDGFLEALKGEAQEVWDDDDSSES